MRLSQRLTFVLAAACGMVAANIYYAQPLIAPISAALGLSHAAAGLIVTMTQIGYGTGLLFIVPLGDLVENRTLICSVITLGAVALLAAAFATHALPFLIAALFIGLGSVAVQIIIPYAAHLAPEAIRGRVVGNVSTGLMLGIMLARPVSSFVTAASSWHAGVLRLRGADDCARSRALDGAADAQAGGAHALRHAAAVDAASGAHHAAAPAARTLPGEPVRLLHPVLDGRTTPARLRVRASPQRGIALFALAGVAGVFAAPIAGRARRSRP
ncbi:hypothetical protein BRDID11002_70940 [Bradyrhizobium diazoefficiens]